MEGCRREFCAYLAKDRNSLDGELHQFSIGADLLYFPFCLPIALWMTPRQEADRHPQEFEEGLPYIEGELGASLTQYPQGFHNCICG